MEEEIKKPKEVDPNDFDARNNMVKLEEFKTKVTNELGLTTRTDKAGYIRLKKGRNTIAILLPRSHAWYGVAHWNDQNKWFTYRIHNVEEEQKLYDHIKTAISTA